MESSLTMFVAVEGKCLLDFGAPRTMGCLVKLFSKVDCALAKGQVSYLQSKSHGLKCC